MGNTNLNTKHLKEEKMMSGKVKINYILFYKLFCIHKKREENKNEKKSNSYF